jgi:hypothetical protein
MGWEEASPSDASTCCLLDVNEMFVYLRRFFTAFYNLRRIF